MNQQALTEEQRIKEQQKLKKLEYAEGLKQEIGNRNKYKELDRLIQQHQNQEAQVLFEQNTQKQLQNEFQYREKFHKFDEKQSKRG